ncbi:MAG: LD-carboxypeptidase [Acidobacteriota bacterium]
MKRRQFLGGCLSTAVLAGGLRSRSAQGAPKTVKPARLRPGDQVALVNPAGATAYRVEVQIVTESLEALGLKVKHSEHLMDRYGYLAGTDAERAADVNAQFADDSVAGIVAVRGGWGCARILPLLDFDMIARNPKILIGYSDVTALLLAVHALTGLVTFHGPVGLGPWNRFTVDYFKRVLFDGEPVLYSNPTNIGDNLTQVADRVQTISPGKARGRLLGGNLTVLSAIVGSRYLPDWDGAILFLEDINEYIYRIDRMLTQLQLAGILGRVSGLVFGQCKDCEPGQGGYGSLTLDQVFDDHIKPLGIPAYQGAMIGHIRNKFTLPEGIPAEIDADQGTIQLLESPVS